MGNVSQARKCACIVFTLVVPKVGKITMQDVEKYQVGHVGLQQANILGTQTRGFGSPTLV